MSEQNISIKNLELSKKFLSLSQLYTNRNKDQEFFSRVNCLKPERGQSLSQYERARVIWSDISFVHGDKGKYIFTSVMGNEDDTIGRMLTYLSAIKKDVSPEDWLKFVKRQNGIFHLSNYRYEKYKSAGFLYECLISMTETSVYHLKSILSDISWSNLSKFEQKQVRDKIPKIHKFNYPQAKGLIAQFLIDNRIDEDAVSELKYLKNSVFEGSSKIVPADFVNIKINDILDVASWNLSAYIRSADILNELTDCLVKNFAHYGIVVSRLKSKGDRFSSTELELVLKKNGQDAEMFITQDISSLIDRIIAQIPTLEDLKGDMAKIMIDEYILDKKIPQKELMEKAKLKF